MAQKSILNNVKTYRDTTTIFTVFYTISGVGGGMSANIYEYPPIALVYFRYLLAVASKKGRYQPQK